MPATAGPTRSATIIKLLRTKGATPLELIAVTDWQPNSVRALLSGLRRKGRSIAWEPRKNGEAAYRIVVAAGFTLEGVTAPNADAIGSSDGWR
ncbi:DUF3489 domain-containing protein (plasmid) [Polymorphobacter sp. PAMC 29334]|uniref:DUF3489 domain-containing protein n=1 Tax=Polymorphobacter sp. PAMC 29334 TaxID=2862331 RepID=UPI001C6835AF|nr:DUF3489 domain-containing protein [Polymorphobacter sp. PAMC 29334]QYE33247.1 DUF3489 domain-containing protein [Polymorphobacter sp. PAMC 29334]